MTKIEYGNRSELYRSSDLKMGEGIAEVIEDVHEGQFPQEDGSIQKKWVLDFESGKGLALNGTNTKFLMDNKFVEYEDLIGKKIVIKKDVRNIKTSKGEKEVVGLFIVSVSDSGSE